MIAYFIYALIGRTCIFFLQRFPFSKLPGVGRMFRSGGFLHDLFACDLCLGVWVYTILAFFFSINLLEGYFYYPVISELITGSVTSLLVFLIRAGWQSEFGVIEVH